MPELENNKIAVLFVDDDPDVIAGYRRMLFSVKNIWSIFFASSGSYALDLLNRKKIDVIITDMRMPVMDGIQLLTKVRNEHPNIIRIILSGNQDELSTLRSTTLAHQFLNKPTSSDNIKKVIQNALSLNKYLENEDLLKIIKNIGILPGSPKIFLELEKELNKSDISFELIRQIISQDPALTAKILQTVNSAFFGLPRRITDILTALSYLGKHTIKSLVLYLETFTTKNSDPKIIKYYNAVAIHSFKTAQLAKEISKHESFDEETINDTFITGILHDIGKLIFVGIPNYIKDLNELTTQENLSESEAEFKLLKVRHEWAGSYLLGLWGLPMNIVEAVAFHNYPEEYNESEISLVTIVCVSTYLVNNYQNDISYNSLIKTYSRLEKVIDSDKFNKWLAFARDFLEKNNE